MYASWVFGRVGDLDAVIRTMDSLCQWWRSTKRGFPDVAELRALRRSPHVCHRSSSARVVGNGLRVALIAPGRLSAITCCTFRGGWETDSPTSEVSSGWFETGECSPVGWGGFLSGLRVLGSADIDSPPFRGFAADPGTIPGRLFFSDDVGK